MKKNKEGFGSIAELTANNFSAEKIFQFWLTKRNDHSSYAEDKGGRRVKRAFPISYPVKLEELISIKNPKTGKLESKIIRHCIGESSIFKDEQSPDDKIPKIVTKLNFLEGYRNILGTDTGILEFLALSNRNASKPDRDERVTPVFFLHDGDALLEKQMEVEDDLFEVQALIRDPKNLDMLVAYARVILSKPDFATIYGKPQHIIHRMLGLAKGNPKLFKDGLNNPATLCKHYILEAIEEGHLTFNEANNALYFKNGELLQQAPIGVNPINIFVDKITEDRTGNTQGLYKMILKSLHKDTPDKKVAIPEERIRRDSEIPEPEYAGQQEEYKLIADRSISKGVITKKGTASFFIHAGTPQQKSFTGFSGARGLVTAMMNNPELLTEIKTMMGEN